MAKKNVLWVILPECPDSFLTKLQGCQDDGAFFTALVEGHEAGFVSILGSTSRDVKDIAAVLQEHFTVKVVTDEHRHNRRHGNR